MVLHLVELHLPWLKFDPLVHLGIYLHLTLAQLIHHDVTIGALPIIIDPIC